MAAVGIKGLSLCAGISFGYSRLFVKRRTNDAVVV